LDEKTAGNEIFKKNSENKFFIKITYKIYPAKLDLKNPKLTAKII
jgi:hypothetical protein